MNIFAYISGLEDRVSRETGNYGDKHFADWMAGTTDEPEKIKDVKSANWLTIDCESAMNANALLTLVTQKGVKKNSDTAMGQHFYIFR